MQGVEVMASGDYFRRFWRGNEVVAGLVESLRLAKEEASRQSGGAVQRRGHYAAHMGAVAVEAGLEGGTLLKVPPPPPSYTQHRA